MIAVAGGHTLVISNGARPDHRRGAGTRACEPENC